MTAAAPGFQSAARAERELAAEGGAIALEEIGTEAALCALAPQWSELLASSRLADRSLFLTPEWLLPWWRSFGRVGDGTLQRRLCVLALRRAGRLCGLAPFVIETERPGGVAVRVLRFLGHSMSDYQDVVLGEGAQALLARLVEHLAARGDWDVLDLREYDARSPWLAPLAELLRAVGWTVRVEPDSACHSTPIEGSWDEFYCARFDSQSRKDQRREWRVLGTEGEVEVELVASPALGPGLLDELAQVEREHPRTSHERPGVLNAEPSRSFLREALPRLDQRGWLTLAQLRIGGQLTAYFLCFRFGGGHTLYSTAYRASPRRAAVGKLLLMRLFEACWASGAGSIDMLRGDQGYKLKVTTAHRRNSRLLAVRGSPAARARGWLWLDALPRLQRASPRLHGVLWYAGRAGWAAAAGRVLLGLGRRGRRVWQGGSA